MAGVRILKALRAENHHHHFGTQDIDHPSKIALKNAFCPPSHAWRATVLENGLKLFLATL